MSGIEDVIGDEVAAALDRADAFRLTKHRLRWSLRLPWDLRSRERSTRGGLAVEYFLGHWYSKPLTLTVPWGWRASRLPHKASIEIMPLWLDLLVRLWDARFRVFYLLTRFGLWRVREGHEYTSGRWTCPRPIARFLWCFLHDADRYPLLTVRVAAGSMTPMPNRRAFIEWAEKQFGPMGGTWGLSEPVTFPHNVIGVDFAQGPSKSVMVFGIHEKDSWAYKAYMKPFLLDG